MDMKTKLGLLALTMLALTATNASAMDMASTEPVPIVDEEQAWTAPVKVEACAALVQPLCGSNKDEAARVFVDAFGHIVCLAVKAGGQPVNCS